MVFSILMPKLNYFDNLLPHLSQLLQLHYPPIPHLPHPTYPTNYLRAPTTPTPTSTYPTSTPRTRRSSPTHTHLPSPAYTLFFCPTSQTLESPLVFIEGGGVKVSSEGYKCVRLCEGGLLARAYDLFFRYFYGKFKQRVNGGKWRQVTNISISSISFAVIKCNTQLAIIYPL